MKINADKNEKNKRDYTFLRIHVKQAGATLIKMRSMGKITAKVRRSQRFFIPGRGGVLEECMNAKCILESVTYRGIVGHAFSVTISSDRVDI
jgi:hypothetical protein